MASPKIGNLTKGNARKIHQISNIELKELLESESTRKRDKQKILKVLTNRGL